MKNIATAANPNWVNEKSFRIRLRKPNDSNFTTGYIRVDLHTKIDNTEPGISLILKRIRDKTQLMIQSLAFNRNPLSVSEKIWTPAEARVWLSKNKKTLLGLKLDLTRLNDPVSL